MRSVSFSRYGSILLAAALAVIPACAQKINLATQVQGELPTGNAGFGVSTAGLTGCASESNGVWTINTANCGVQQVTGPSSTVNGDLTFSGPGVTQSGNTFTFTNSGGTLTNFSVGSWPSWLTPTVTSATTTPTLAVSASAIPNSALAGPLVNSISNSDGSLTISPTTGAVVGSLNIAHSNTWTALQSFAGIDNSGGYTQTGTDTNTFTGNTSVYVGTSDLQLGSGLTFPNTGPSFTWNIGSDNETDFINTSNLESEAFAWYSFAPGAVSPYPSPIMTLDLGGALTTNNIQATGYFVQTGTGGNSFSGPSSFATITNSGGYTQSGTAANTFTGTVTAPTFSGALSGNATTATTATTADNAIDINGGLVPTSATVVGTNSSGQLTAVTSLPYSFLTGTPATGVSSVFGRTGAVVAETGDYTVSEVTGAAPLASPTFTGTVTAPEFSGYNSGSMNGYTGAGQDPVFSSPSAWAALPWQYSDFVSAVSSATPPGSTYGYFLKIANRDVGGWGGLWVDYNTGNLWSGYALSDSSYAAWNELAPLASPTFTGTVTSPITNITESFTSSAATNVFSGLGNGNTVFFQRASGATTNPVIAGTNSAGSVETWDIDAEGDGYFKDGTFETVSMANLSAQNSTVATITSSGTGTTAVCNPTISCTNVAGQLTVAPDTTSITVTFGTANTELPVCTVTQNGGSTSYMPSWTTSTTALTITPQVSITASTAFDYICIE